MRHGKQLDKHLFIELYSVYLLGVLSLFLSLLGVLRQIKTAILSGMAAFI